MREFLPSTNLYNVTEYSDANDQEEQIFWRDKGSVKKNAELWEGLWENSACSWGICYWWSANWRKVTRKLASSLLLISWIPLWYLWNILKIILELPHNIKLLSYVGIFITSPFTLLPLQHIWHKFTKSLAYAQRTTHWLISFLIQLK